MKRQLRPFIVEHKHKRGISKQGGSIWGAIDLSSIAAELTTTELTNSRLIDSGVTHVVSEDWPKPPLELAMTYPEEAESLQTTTEEPKVLPTKKPRRVKTAQVPGKRSSRKEAVSDVQPAAQPSKASSSVTGRKVYSANERAQKLAQIEKAIGSGESVKAATKQAEVSQQTYYQWKRVAAPSTGSGELKDLVALEEENKRLKSILAERLRKENAELKKRLGLE